MVEGKKEKAQAVGLGFFYCYIHYSELEEMICHLDVIDFDFDRGIRALTGFRRC
jgi:hypothetical protein